MSMILTLFTIALIITVVWDILMFPNEIAGKIASWLTGGKITNVTLSKPWGCSLCMTFWCGLIYVLITIGFVSISTFITNLCICLLVAYSTTYIQLLITTLDKLILNLFCVLEKLIDKLN